MKKGKIPVVITLAFVCFILTTVMFMQFKFVQETDLTSIETMKEEELREELANWKQMYKNAQEQYTDKISKLAEYRKKEQSIVESADLVKDELIQIDTYLGKTDVQGEGIIIKINDINDGEVEPISADDLLIIVDYLKLAGAEAISINEERIINTSDIVYVNNSVIYVNQRRILAPYVIKVIGDPVALESTLLGNGGYVELLKNIGFDIQIDKQNNVTIPKYSKDISDKYIQ